jgi:hypothetical protein
VTTVVAAAGVGFPPNEADDDHDASPTSAGGGRMASFLSSCRSIEAGVAAAFGGSCSFFFVFFDEVLAFMVKRSE